MAPLSIYIRQLGSLSSLHPFVLIPQKGESLNDSLVCVELDEFHFLTNLQTIKYYATQPPHKVELFSS